MVRFADALIRYVYATAEEVADYRAEIGRLSRIIHDLRNPEQPPDPETADAMARISADYLRYRGRRQHL